MTGTALSRAEREDLLLAEWDRGQVGGEKQAVLGNRYPALKSFGGAAT
jgi:hypothetical protein